MINKEQIKSLVILIKQNGDCDSPISIYCPLCALDEYCTTNLKKLEPDNAQQRVYEEAIRIFSQFSNETIFEMLL